EGRTDGGELGRDVGQADGLLEGGAHGPRGDHAHFPSVVEDRIAAAGDATVLEGEAHELSVHALGALAKQRLLADEIVLVELDHPVEAGLEGRVFPGELVAVEAERRLQAKGIARAQAAGPGSGLDERRPQRLRVLGAAEELEAVLAGVAGPRHDGRLAGEVRLGEAEVADRGEVDRGEWLQGGLRPGTLESQEGQAVAVVSKHGSLRSEPGKVRLAVGRVDHDEDPLCREAVADHVVDHLALVVDDDGVERPAVLDSAEVVGDQPVAVLERAGPLEDEDAHVRDVEEAGIVADGVVLLQHGGVLDGHLPAGEFHHLRAGTKVGVIKGGAAKRHRFLRGEEPACGAIGLRGPRRMVPAATVRSSGPTRTRGPYRALAACRVLARSMAMVIGPTPPGTGVMAPARSFAASKSTSPTSLPSGRRLIPTSTTKAPSLIQSPWTSFGRPTAATTISACRTSAARSGVFEWQMVTVASASRSKRASGLPTMFERPITTAFFPRGSQPPSSRRRMMPSGVQARMPPRRPVSSLPALTRWK